MNKYANESAIGFIRRWKTERTPSPSVADDYLSICPYIQRASKSLLLEVLEILRSNMENWSLEHSPVYMRTKPFYCKEDLEDKSKWYVPEMTEHSVMTHTSGSSTGFHFMYRRMKSTFERIEWDNHYDMVLNEFGIPQVPNILYFFPNYFKKSGGEVVFFEKSPQPYLNSHGRSRAAFVHYANFDLYKSDPSRFFSLLFDYLSRNKMDVFFSAGPQISSMCHHLRNFGLKDKLASLLSQTNEMLLQDDAEFLFGYFDHICDHMRCWDGGASFFTCKFGNYHLMDNLSWCEEVEGRLVSTDYFNFASPFVRYWNGDICSISKDFSRCDCGRLFREFEFKENRPFSLNGVSLGELRSKMTELDIPSLTQVRCYVDSVNVVSAKPLSDHEKMLISCLEPKLKFVFVVEG